MGHSEQPLVIPRTKSIGNLQSSGDKMISDLLQALVERRMNPVTVAEILQAQFQEAGLRVESLTADTACALLELFTQQTLSLDVEPLVSSLTLHPTWPDFLSASAAAGCFCFFINKNKSALAKPVMESCARLLETLWKQNSIRLSRKDRVRIANTLAQYAQDLPFWGDATKNLYLLAANKNSVNSQCAAGLKDNNHINHRDHSNIVNSNNIDNNSKDIHNSTRNASISPGDYLSRLKEFLQFLSNFDEALLNWEHVWQKSCELELLMLPNKWQDPNFLHQSIWEMLIDPTISPKQLELVCQWMAYDEDQPTSEDFCQTLNWLTAQIKCCETANPLYEQKLVAAAIGLSKGLFEQNTARQNESHSKRKNAELNTKSTTEKECLINDEFMKFLCCTITKLSKSQRKKIEELFLVTSKILPNDNKNRAKILCRENLNWIKVIAESSWADEIKTLPNWVQESILEWCQQIFYLAPQHWLNSFGKVIFECLSKAATLNPTQVATLLPELVRNFRKKSPGFACRPESVIAIACLVTHANLSAGELRALSILSDKFALPEDQMPREVRQLRKHLLSGDIGAVNVLDYIFDNRNPRAELNSTQQRNLLKFVCATLCSTLEYYNP